MICAINITIYCWDNLINTMEGLLHILHAAMLTLGAQSFLICIHDCWFQQQINCIGLFLHFFLWIQQQINCIGLFLHFFLWILGVDIESLDGMQDIWATNCIKFILKCHRMLTFCCFFCSINSSA